MSDPEDGDDSSPPTQTSTVRQRPPRRPPAPPGTGAAGPSGSGPIAYRAGLLRAHLGTARTIYCQAAAGRVADAIVVIADVEDARTASFAREILFDNGLRQSPRAVRAAGGAIVILPATRARAKEALRRLSEEAADTVETRREGWYLVVIAGGGGFTFTLDRLALGESGRIT